MRLPGVREAPFDQPHVPVADRVRPHLALRHCGAVVAEDRPPDIGKLVEQLHASDTNSRRDAALQLGQVGPAAKDAVPALVKALGDSDKQVWSYAIGALAALGPEAKEAIPALLDGHR